MSQEYASVKKRHTSSRSDADTLTPSHSHGATQEKVNKQTRLNARLTTALKGIFEVVYRPLAVEALFAEANQAWQSKDK